MAIQIRSGWARAARRQLFVLAILLLGTGAVSAQPVFTQNFSPDTIGPGTVSVLTFTIENASGSAAADLAFVNNLPAGLTLATGANPFSNCTDAIVSAPDGGSTITFSEARLGAGVTCIVRVDVTAAAPGLYMNVSGDLTSTLGNSGPATDDLTVNSNRLDFSKAFSPALVQVGNSSRLTFTIDATLIGTNTFNISFTDFLPDGLLIADDPQLVTDCFGSVTADPGGDVISHFSGFLMPGAQCQIALDVVALAAGRFDNRSGIITSSSGNSGGANAVLNAARTTLLKSFAGPARPGGIVELTFDIRNYDRGDDLTVLTFSDDLDAMLSGAVAVGLPLNDVCGAGSQISGTSLVTLSNATLPPSGNCQFSISVQIPAGATAGVYSNTTSAITGLLSAAPFADVAATADLQVVAAPSLTKTIIPATARPGEMVTVEFTLTSVDPINDATDVQFTDVVGEWLPIDQFYVRPANGYCNGTGVSSQFSLLNVPRLTFSGITLAAGASCTFAFSLTLPADIGSGSYLNTVDRVTATVNGTTASGSGASDILNVVAAPNLSKAFVDDPVNGGDLVTLEFTLSHGENAPTDATAISFSDDLNAALAGLTAVGLPLANPCGSGSLLSGTTNLSFTGGTLAPGTSCSFSVQLQVPAGAAPGDYTNTTSNLSATVAGLNISDGPPASAILRIQPLTISKQFVESPIFTGSSAVTLEFTLQNLSATEAVTGIFFTDSVNQSLSGLGYSGPALMDPCGPGSQLTGTTFLILTGGTLAPGASCSFSVVLDVPPGAAPGDYPNRSSDVTGTVDGNVITFPAANATLQIVQPLSLSKAFTDDPVQAGGTVTLEFTIDNADPAQAITAIAFTDNLEAVLPGLIATGLPMANVCGAGSTLSGSSMLTLIGAQLPAGSSCTFSVTLQLPAGASPGTYVNQTSDINGTAGGLGLSAPGASDLLLVNGNVDFSKNFSSDVFPGNLVTLTFTLTNTDASAASDLRFVDDLDAMLSGAVAVGLPLTDPCGPGSSLSGSSVITLTGVNLAPMGGSCSFNVDVQIPAAAAPGTYANLTAALTAASTPIAPGATANLLVNPLPLFSKAFAASPVFVGQTVQLGLVIDNSASTLAASGLDFTDNLPAGMVVASPANAATTCTGGTLTATVGSGVISYSGGTVAAGASCTVNVDVVASSNGALVNTSGDLTSVAGNSGSASATLVVDPLPLFSKRFIPDTVFLGETATLIFEIDNAAVTQQLNSVAFTDLLPAGLLIATPANAGTACGGTLTAPDGGTLIELSGGIAPANGSCSIAVDVLAASVGDLLNTTSALSYSGASSPAASDTLRVNPLPLFSKAFAPAGIPEGSVSTLTLTIDNSGSTAAATNLAFVDTYPAGLVNATPANASTTCTGGTLSAAAGGGSISYSGGTIAAGAVCMLSVDVTAPSGSYLNTSGDLSFSGGAVGGPSATLTVGALPVFSKLFVPDALFVNQPSRLTLSIDHSGGLLDATALDVTDNLPAGLLIATPGNASSTCVGGTLTATDGGGVISYRGGSVVAGGSCEIGVDVVAANAGSYLNTSGDLTSSLGNSGSASDTLNVDPAPGLAKAFAPTQVFIGQISTVTLSIDNSGSAQDLTGVSLSDALPAGLVVATPANAATTCVGGTLTAASGATTVSYSGGTVTAGTSCTISFDVDASATGSLLNSTSDLVSNAGTVAGASDTLLVDPVPLFSKAFAPDTMAIDDISVLTLSIDNSGSATAISAIDFTDNLPAGVVVATPANATTTCSGGTLTAAAGGSVISYSGGSLAAGASCTVSAEVTSAAQGVYVNTSGDLSSSAGNSGPASATLTVSTRPAFSKVFAPTALFVNQPARLSLLIDHSAGALDATALTVTDNLPAGLLVATPANASSTCIGGSIVAVPGSAVLSYSGGSVAAGASCEVAVDVAAATAGSYLNTTGDLISSLGNSGSASATLLVDSAPTLAKAFAPDLLFVGQTSTVTLSIDNSSSSQALTGISVADPLPVGLQVASPANAASTCAGGTLTANPGTTNVAYSGGGLAAGASCTIVFDVIAISAGDLLNSAGPLTSNAGDSGGASAVLVADPLPTLSKAFDPAMIVVGDQTLVVISIDNSASTQPVTGLAFTDDLPGSMRVATPNQASHDCGPGTLVAPSGAVSVSFSGGSVAAGATCTVSFAVVAPLQGNFLNITSPLTSDVGNAPGGASAELNVQPSTVAIDATSRWSLLLLSLLMVGAAVLVLTRRA